MAHHSKLFTPRFIAIFIPSHPLVHHIHFLFHMAALPVVHLTLTLPFLIPRKESRKLSVISCCQSSDNPLNAKKRNKEKMEEKGVFELNFAGIKKFGEGLRDNMRPKQKGDWKDVALMSLSFAVYVYMSQKIVCAYCVWMSMPRQTW